MASGKLMLFKGQMIHPLIKKSDGGDNCDGAFTQA